MRKKWGNEIMPHWKRALMMPSDWLSQLVMMERPTCGEDNIMYYGREDYKEASK